MTKPKVFWLHINALWDPDGDIWAVKWKNKYIYCKHVYVYVDVKTVFRGLSFKQPKAFLKGIGVVRKNKTGEVFITRD